MCEEAGEDLLNLLLHRCILLGNVCCRRQFWCILLSDFQIKIRTLGRIEGVLYWPFWGRYSWKGIDISISFLGLLVLILRLIIWWNFVSCPIKKTFEPLCHKSNPQNSHIIMKSTTSKIILTRWFCRAYPSSPTSPFSVGVANITAWCHVYE